MCVNGENMFDIKGLNKIQKQLKELQDVLASLNGELGKIKFDPFDPCSIEKAIHDTYQIIDECTTSYTSTFTISMIKDIKENFRSEILKKAAEARLCENKEIENE